MFGLSGISDRFCLGRVWFGSGRFWVNQFLVKYARHAKTSKFVKNFESVMVQFESIQISGLFFSEYISNVESNIDLNYSVQILNFRSSLLGLILVLGGHPYSNV